MPRLLLQIRDLPPGGERTVAWERDLMADLALDCSHSALILLVDMYLAEVLLHPSAWMLAPGLRSVLAIVVESPVLTATCSPCRQFTQWLDVTHGQSPPFAVTETPRPNVE